MIDKSDTEKIKKMAEEFFQKLTIDTLRIEVDSSVVENKQDSGDVININIKLAEPQVLIGEKGQTLFETQRLLRTILNRKLQKFFYLNLDINDYKKKKAEYLKNLAKDLADEVALTKEEKVLLPMPSHERRIIHTELSQRTDVVTESRGENLDRYIVIRPK